MQRPPELLECERDLARLVRARFDVRCADALASVLAGHRDSSDPYAWGLLTGTVVSYARPFTTSYAFGRLPECWAEFGERTDLRAAHERLLELRHGLLAHNDETGHRGTVVFGSGAFFDHPAATEQRASVQAAGMPSLRELFRFQDERMGEGVLSLARTYEELGGVAPGQTVEY